jgi:hypothetical protein
MAWTRIERLRGRRLEQGEYTAPAGTLAGAYGTGRLEKRQRGRWLEQGSIQRQRGGWLEQGEYTAPAGTLAGARGVCGEAGWSKYLSRRSRFYEAVWMVNGEWMRGFNAKTQGREGVRKVNRVCLRRVCRYDNLIGVIWKIFFRL